MGAGRPTDYKSEYCDEAVKYIGGGKSKEAFAGHIGHAVSTIYLWEQVHPEFSEAVKRGEAMSQDFWEELGLVGTTEGKNFNATTWIFNMKNRFKWKDRHDITSDDKELKGLVQVDYVTQKD